jgi:hypothetical protein
LGGGKLCAKMKVMAKGTKRALKLLAGLAPVLAVFVPHIAAAQDKPKPPPVVACKAPAPVCDARAAIFRIAAFDTEASAVRLGPDILVSNRHVMADRNRVEITLKDGRKIEGRVLPSAYEGDLVLIEAGDLPPGPGLAPVNSDFAGDLFTVAFDLSRRAVRVYPPGRLIAKPYKGRPFARLHHSAFSQYGNSGGALVDAQGRLVAVIASGGEGRFDAVPAVEIETLKRQSGGSHKSRARLMGAALGACVLKLEKLPRNLRNFSDERARELYEICLGSLNRPLYDRAAQALGRAGKHDLSVALAKAALERDPNSTLTRQTLVTSLFISRRYKEALPHIKVLIAALPENPVIQRFAVQAGKWGGDMALARQGLALVKKHNPAQAEAAERFLKANIPAPKPRR